ncbi:Txe/YoeB family addiction module toxin [Pseudomonas syringae]|nr:Txe/YoeB family addiction module toxin [Pseudomonas syringae]MCQ3029151.1 Txe/YoeB family addiction module toxin [Pseudomonas syringae]MDG6399760.1 Txe/YoeB family addiction module toxin [Pseudomonas quasicaspiana]
MNVLFTPEAWDDYLWFQQNDKTSLKRVNLLIKAIQRGDPFEGIGKPEPLKHNLSGFWSRRITHEHRLIYTVEDGELQIVQCRYHY